MTYLSSLNRRKIIEQLSTDSYDLAVIGGGITGAGIALDAASRGLKVALIEKNDFASGTSSKSTKLIHGGLRYLKQFEIGLVREVGRERAIVHKLAPHLVISEKMLLPLVKGGTYGELGTSVGLWVYDVLAGVSGEDKRRMLSRKKTLQKEPLLREDILTGSGFYAEYRTDDARLTIENIKTAVKHGAVVINHVKAVDFVYSNDEVSGINCEDIKTGASFKIGSKYIVNAAGPWVDKLRKKDNSLKGKHLFLSKGVHIVVPHERFPLNHSVYFDVPDGRMIFAIPRHRSTYIGTTDTSYEGDLNNIPIYQEDVDYLLDAVNSMFPTANLTTEDVESSWAGLRPLIHEEGKSPSEMSRKDELFISESGLISIAGGKLTGYRKMAQRVVDMVTQRYQENGAKEVRSNYTDKIPLSGGPFKNTAEVKQYIRSVEEKLKNLDLAAHYPAYLVANYGKQSETIIEKLSSFKDPAEIALARAEAWYCIHEELAFTPLDFYNRRTGRLYFDLPSIHRTKEAVLKDFRTYFDWDEKEFNEQSRQLNEMLHRSANFEYENAGASAVS